MARDKKTGGRKQDERGAPAKPRSLDDLIPAHWRDKTGEDDVLSIIGAPPQGRKRAPEKPRRMAPGGEGGQGRGVPRTRWRCFPMKLRLDACVRRC
jgi:hypothetical protein